MDHKRIRLGNVLLAVAGISLLAAIWAPGAWWQWLLTAVVTLFAAAALFGNAEGK